LHPLKQTGLQWFYLVAGNSNLEQYDNSSLVLFVALLYRKSESGGGSRETHTGGGQQLSGVLTSYIFWGHCQIAPVIFKYDIKSPIYAVFEYSHIFGLRNLL